MTQATYPDVCAIKAIKNKIKELEKILEKSLDEIETGIEKTEKKESQPGKSFFQQQFDINDKESVVRFADYYSYSVSLANAHAIIIVAYAMANAQGNIDGICRLAEAMFKLLSALDI